MPDLCDGSMHLPRQSGGQVDGRWLGLCCSCLTFQVMERHYGRLVLAPHTPEFIHPYCRTGAPVDPAT